MMSQLLLNGIGVNGCAVKRTFAILDTSDVSENWRA